MAQIVVPYRFELIVVGSNGSDPHAVAQASRRSVFNPFFSPAGTRLAVTQYSRRGYEQLATIALDGSAPTRVFQGTCRWPACEFPSRVIGWASVSQSAGR